MENFGFRLPDGAELISHTGDEIKMTVAIPTDQDGFFGRQCPGCSRLFRIDADDYEALPDEVELWCVYCGHHAEHSEFITQQQLDRATRAMGDYAVQMIGQQLDSTLSGLFGSSRPPRSSRGGFGVEFSFQPGPPFVPQPLPGIDEERLIRIRSCAGCGLRYAVFADHRFCPQCGQLPAKTVAEDALAAETARLDALTQVPEQAAAALREQGAFDRILTDTLSNVAGIVETLAGAAFRTAVPNSNQLLVGKGNVFQRLDHAADLFVTAGYPDLRTLLDAATWQRLLETWAKRHVFIHNDGMVDSKYLTKVPASTSRIGQRLAVTEPECRQVIADTRALCTAIATIFNL
ncbi:hypothetical protein B0I32_1454 [Nonomuraea fuscirosea]|uniref:Uncharacterized protein n=1 Tax=Nonomuraea fuscirosea TaxID=1291556 RepID=A0A2T0LRV3_9ACTN|nr:hypothetical protein [Nonomuraea fuscirosea]PRX46315.1 hypothetical protein B0I32_1454 [Nonomuraea fuscirosea]